MILVFWILSFKPTFSLSSFTFIKKLFSSSSLSAISEKSEVAQSCPSLYDPMDFSLLRSSIHGIFQATVLEWVAISFSRGSSQPRDQTKDDVICTSKVIDISPGNLDSPCKSSSPAFHMMYSAYKLNKHSDNDTALTDSFSYLQPVCCSMSSSNCCLLTCIQVSQEAGQVVRYSHLFQNSTRFLVIHLVKGFGIVNKAEIDVFLELSCFFRDPADVGNLISSSSAFSKTSLNIW